MDRNVLEHDLRELLDQARMQDYCPNGLQLEGRSQIRRVLTGVTASQGLIDLAVELNADAILVHHGLMWKGDPQVVTGFRKVRLKAALGHDLNVFAYHLPLDKHPELGNNAQLGKMLGWPSDRVLGDKGLIHFGELAAPQNLQSIVDLVVSTLGHRVQVEGAEDPQRLVRTVAWCTGGAPGYVEQAALAGADLYLTGELSEPAVHVARECGVSLLGAGHHATERCGVKALGEWVAQRYGIEVVFQDLFVAV
ncbi:MAG: Nif3-like dinuclear metal center hexameric protein [Limnobacter sp.]|uniref:Nif3-like dinuclear metal center hexameric protein n=1 Tax=Limnobacter sp. TaxID=2003368 RepID=UPI0022C5A6EF|nr:Nif3-like dinuclear metal center hexameric protein [Limnobacter sp.]MCZ8016960.1 Nif3-like dinuclear metal center hexameric protein [Limnobacter sp.]